MENKSSWSKAAGYRRKNRKWLKYSSNIARRILAAIDDREDLKNQTDLAKLLKVTPQQISKIVQGRENLTLETIANLSSALETELISFPAFKDSYEILPTELKIPLNVRRMPIIDELVKQQGKSSVIEGAYNIGDTGVFAEVSVDEKQFRA